MAPRLCTLLLLLAALALAQVVSAERNPILGAPEDADINDEDVQEALEFALSEYNKANDDENHSRVLQVKRAQRQVSPLRYPRGNGRNVGTGVQSREICGHMISPASPCLSLSGWKGCSLTPQQECWDIGPFSASQLWYPPQSFSCKDTRVPGTQAADQVPVMAFFSDLKCQPGQRTEV